MNNSSWGVMAVLAAALLWGTTGTAAALAPQVGPLAIGAAAMGVGGLLQAGIAVRPIVRARAELGGHRRLVLLGAVSVAVYPLAFYSSMRLGGVAIGTVVSLASAPLCSALVERTVTSAALTRQWIAAVGLAVLGSALLCLSRGDGPRASTIATLGSVVLGLLAGGTYALYSFATHRLMQHGIDRQASMGTVFGVGGMLLLPVLLITGAPLLAGPRAFAVAAYMAAVPMFLGYLFFGLGLQRVSPSTATTLTMAEPALAAVLAVVILGERMAATGWVGLGLIAAALAVMAILTPGHYRVRIPRWGRPPGYDRRNVVVRSVEHP